MMTIGYVAKIDAWKDAMKSKADGGGLPHRNSVLDGAFDHLAIGSRVIFSEEIGEKGSQAKRLSLLGKHSFRL